MYVSVNCVYVLYITGMYVSCVQHKRRRIKSISDDEDDEQVAETGEDGKELIENEIFGRDDDDDDDVDDDDDRRSVTQQQQQPASQTDFDLEQSDDESGIMMSHCH